MTRIVAKLCAAAASVALIAGFGGIAAAQQPPKTVASGPPGAGSYPDTSQESDAAGPSGASRPLEMPVLYVTSIEVMPTSANPKLDIIRVTGLASSAGWSAPQLVPFFYGKPADGILDLQFIATSPEQSQKAEGFQPLSALFTLEAGHDFKGVRVRAGANAIELKQMSGSVQTTIKADSGGDMIGKKFVEKGPAGPGVVTAAELPRGFRTITPTHGVAGITHNPNRLNVILDSDSKIVMTFWE
ncbi:MAG TPA: hypothetical protein VND87_12355 [Stellaceae bacterium]|nr:hypothetical protein [Stellaceae bacterium]